MHRPLVDLRRPIAELACTTRSAFQPELHLLNKLSGALQGVGNGQVLRHHVLPRGASYLIRQIVASTNDAFGQATADAPAATA